MKKFMLGSLLVGFSSYAFASEVGVCDAFIRKAGDSSYGTSTGKFELQVDDSLQIENIFFRGTQEIIDTHQDNEQGYFVRTSRFVNTERSVNRIYVASETNLKFIGVMIPSYEHKLYYNESLGVLKGNFGLKLASGAEVILQTSVGELVLNGNFFTSLRNMYHANGYHDLQDMYFLPTTSDVNGFTDRALAQYLNPHSCL